MKNKNIRASNARPKISITNRTKIIIPVIILLLLLLIILIANKNKLFKTNKLATNEYAVTINTTTVDVSRVITNEPNPPVLGAGMIPVKWDGEAWVITTVEDWYDYSNGIPANVMLSDRIL